MINKMIKVLTLQAALWASFLSPLMAFAFKVEKDKESTLPGKQTRIRKYIFNLSHYVPFTF